MRRRALAAVAGIATAAVMLGAGFGLYLYRHPEWRGHWEERGRVRVAVSAVAWPALREDLQQAGGSEAAFYPVVAEAGLDGLMAGRYQLGIFPGQELPSARQTGLALEVLASQPRLLVTHFLTPVESLNLGTAVALADGVVPASTGYGLPLTLSGPPDSDVPGVLTPGEVAVGGWELLGPGRKLLRVGGHPDPLSATAVGDDPLAEQLLLVGGRPPDAFLARWLGPDPGLVAAVRERLLSAGVAGESTGKPALMSLSVVGDVMLARGVAQKIAEQGTGYPFARTATRLGQADFTVANLESPLGEKGRPIPMKQIWFRAPADYVAALQDAGIDLVTVANNHIMDYDVDNFLETLGILAGAGVKVVGGGSDLEAARSPVVLAKNGVRVAFLGYSAFAHLFWSWDYPLAFAAQGDRPGVAPLDPDRLDEIAADIRAAREKADLVAVMYHWGEEYVNFPSPEQRALAHTTVDLGADLVLGFHPHAIQGLEFYHDRLIAYSLGNFVMDQRRPVTTESMILELLLGRDGIHSVRVVPVAIREGQPVPLTGREGHDLLEKIADISRFPR